MKTYILKYTVYNDIDFPIGTVVKVIDPKWEFEVVEGRLTGKRGQIADGLKGWLLENTAENKNLFAIFNQKTKELEKAIRKLNKEWNSLKPVEDL